jgi:hypothetical protein
MLLGMVTSLAIDVITIALAAVGVTLAISTLQATAAASRERTVGAVVAASALVDTAVAHPHPPTSPPYLAASTSAPAGLVAGAARPLDVVITVGDPTVIAACVAGPWASDTAAGTPAWLPFNLSMGGAPYWSTSHTFTAPQYGFLVQPVCHPPSTRPWTEPRTGRRHMPSSRRPSVAFWCSKSPYPSQQSPPSMSWFGEWDP